MILDLEGAVCKVSESIERKIEINIKVNKNLKNKVLVLSKKSSSICYGCASYLSRN